MTIKELYERYQQEGNWRKREALVKEIFDTIGFSIYRISETEFVQVFFDSNYYGYSLDVLTEYREPPGERNEHLYEM